MQSNPPEPQHFIPTRTPTPTATPQGFISVLGTPEPHLDVRMYEPQAEPSLGIFFLVAIVGIVLALLVDNLPKKE